MLRSIRRDRYGVSAIVERETSLQWHGHVVHANENSFAKNGLDIEVDENQTKRLTETTMVRYDWITMDPDELTQAKEGEDIELLVKVEFLTTLKCMVEKYASLLHTRWELVAVPPPPSPKKFTSLMIENREDMQRERQSRKKLRHQFLL